MIPGLVITRARSARSNPVADLPDRHAGLQPARDDWLAYRGPVAMLYLFALGLFFLAACASPEATRTRGGGPGADVKNWGQPVELHAGAEPYYKTPCAMEPVECTGPPPVFGPTPPPD
jgi:hypothetical protein